MTKNRTAKEKSPQRGDFLLEQGTGIDLHFRPGMGEN